mmetsp:Transcript_23350/g.64548  ORF Transcript_23350/g.64548 Transcript_23350/m.64548 type:complete len:84 (-) Transcript_23350:1438-1689(-)
MPCRPGAPKSLTTKQTPDCEMQTYTIPAANQQQNEQACTHTHIHTIHATNQSAQMHQSLSDPLPLPLPLPPFGFFFSLSGSAS